MGYSFVQRLVRGKNPEVHFKWAREWSAQKDTGIVNDKPVLKKPWRLDDRSAGVLFRTEDDDDDDDDDDEDGNFETVAIFNSMMHDHAAGNACGLSIFETWMFLFPVLSSRNTTFSMQAVWLRVNLSIKSTQTCPLNRIKGSLKSSCCDGWWRWDSGAMEDTIYVRVWARTRTHNSSSRGSMSIEESIEDKVTILYT